MTTLHKSTGFDRLPAVTMRPAKEPDAAQIVALLASPQDLRQVAPDEDFPLDERTVQHWIRSRAAGHVLVERGKVVAYAELVRDSNVAGRLWIGHMMVDPQRRGLGLGQRLVNGMLQIARNEQSAREVAISAFTDNPRALQCYRSCGFRDRAHVRAGDRELIELRYPIPEHRPVVELATAAGSVAVGFAIGVVTLLDTWRGFDWIAAIPLVSVVALTAWAAHALVPARRRDRALRLWRTTIYALAVGLATLAVATLLHFARGIDLTRMSVAIAVGTGITGAMLLVAANRSGRVVDGVKR